MPEVILLIIIVNELGQLSGKLAPDETPVNHEFTIYAMHDSFKVIPFSWIW
jgi:hypothetical protein